MLYLEKWTAAAWAALLLRVCKPSTAGSFPVGNAEGAERSRLRMVSTGNAFQPVIVHNSWWTKNLPTRVLRAGVTREVWHGQSYSIACERHGLSC